MNQRLVPNAASASYLTLLAICCSLALASYLGSYLRIPVVPLFAASLGASTLEVGLINSIFLLMAGLLSFPFGLLSDRWGRKALIVGGLLVSAGTAWLLAVSRTPGQLMAISFLFGVGLAAVGPTLMSYVADISPASHLGRSYGWYTTAIYTGMSLGPALGGWLAQGLGFRSLFSLSGFFVLVLGGTALVILPRRPATARPDRPGAVPVSTLLRHNRGLQGCWLGTLGSCFGWGVFLTFAPLQMHNCGLTLGQIGLVCAVQTGINAISRLPLGRLSDRVQERWRLAGLGLVCFAASLAAFGAAATLRQFFLAAVALGVSMGLTFTPMGALVAEVVPPQAKGVAMGGYNTCIYLGMMLGSACLGGLIEKWGYGASFVGTALVVLLFTGVFYLLLRDVTPPQGNRQ